MRDMTVVLGTICQSEKTVVLAADRASMVATPGGPMVFDSPTSKIRILRNGVAIAISGDAVSGLEIVGRMGNIKLAEIPEWINREREACRDKVVKQRCQGDSRLQRWIDQSRAESDVCRWLEFGFIRHSWGLDFLIAGIDESGPHIWTITEPEGSACVSNCNGSGFAAIGVGATKAMFTLGPWAAEADKDLSIAVYAAFQAKKEAEQISGIGDKTELVILRDGVAPVQLETVDLKPLKKVHKKMQPALTPKLRQELQEFIKRKT
jgi:20S proteasome alpha/beta subunit